MFLKNTSCQYFKRFSVSAAASMMMATSALAVAPPSDSFTVNGELGAGDLENFAPSVGGNGRYYDLFQIEITDVALFAASISSMADILVGLYSDAPDPNSHLTNLIAGFAASVSDPGTLTEGEYTLVATSNYVGGTGNYILEVMGAILIVDLLTDEIATDQIKVAANHIAQALSASIFSAVKSGLAGGTPVVSREAPGLNTTDGNRTWFQMDYTAIDGTDLDGRFPTMQAGLDFQLENGMIVGAALGYSDFSITSAASDLDGTSLSIQPYLGFSAGKLTGAVTLSFGKLDLETTDGAGTAEGDTRALSLSLERPFALGGNQMIASFDGGFGRQEIDSATGSLAGMADTYSTWSYASLGARYEMQAGAALVSFGASVDYNDVGNLDNIAADHYGSDGFTGAVNFGLDYQMGSGSNLYVNAEIGGIGGDALRKSVQAGIDFRF